MVRWSGHFNQAETMSAIDKARLAVMDNIETARLAIMNELAARAKRESGFNRPVPAHASVVRRTQGNQKHYWCGFGIIPCPVCKTGDLNYSRTANNGHVSASCTTTGCVQWCE